MYEIRITVPQGLGERGFPDAHTTTMRILTFFLNAGAIALFALVGYMALAMKRREVKRFIE